MRIRRTQQGEVMVLAFVAAEVLDCYVAADVKAQAFRRIERRADVVLDLSGLEFVDSAGLGVLVGIYKRVTSRGRRVVLAGAQPYVARAMHIIRLDRLFESFPDVTSAVSALSRGAVVGIAGKGTPG